MTKLEQKLIELGYIKLKPRSLKYGKYVNRYEIVVDTSMKPIKSYIAMESFWLKNQKEIDDLQQTFDIMHKYLEVLKQCQD